jgi:cell filamentation protein
MPTPDGLPDLLRHAIDQTVAAERLEGWRPTDAHIGALVALVCGEVSFGQYLAVYRARYPSDGSASHRDYRHIFRRSRPYLIPGTTVLRNNFGVESQEALSDLEFVATAGRIAGWHCRLAQGAAGMRDVDVQTIHQHVFADVYPWAGAYRVTELRRGDAVFTWQSAIGRSMGHVHESARAIANHGASLDAPALAYRLACLYADYNHVHPFREGNGRAGSLLLHTVTALCGRRLDFSGVSREQWYAASRDSMPFRRDGRAKHRPFLPLLIDALR